MAAEGVFLCLGRCHDPFSAQLRCCEGRESSVDRHERLLELELEVCLTAISWINGLLGLLDAKHRSQVRERSLGPLVDHLLLLYGKRIVVVVEDALLFGFESLLQREFTGCWFLLVHITLQF